MICIQQNKFSPKCQKVHDEMKKTFFCVDVTSSMTSKDKFTVRMTIKKKNCVIYYNCQIHLVSFISLFPVPT